MTLNYEFAKDYVTYDEFVLGVLDKVVELLRGDMVIKNYQFRAVELVGIDFVPDGGGTPAIRVIPDRDTIRQNETNTRDHDVRFGVAIFDRKRDKGEDSYREHVRISGRIVDLLVNNRDLDGLAQDVEVEQIFTRYGFLDEAGGNMNFVTMIRVNVFSTKEE